MRKTPKPYRVVLFGKMIIFAMIAVLILIVFLIYKTVLVHYF